MGCVCNEINFKIDKKKRMYAECPEADDTDEYSHVRSFVLNVITLYHR